jgi:hypothetical protein
MAENFKIIDVKEILNTGNSILAIFKIYECSIGTQTDELGNEFSCIIRNRLIEDVSLFIDEVPTEESELVRMIRTELINDTKTDYQLSDFDVPDYV